MAGPTKEQLRRIEKMTQQLAIPGLEPPVAAPKLANIQRQLADLRDRVLKLELEVSLLRILMEKGGRVQE